MDPAAFRSSPALRASAYHLAAWALAAAALSLPGHAQTQGRPWPTLPTAAYAVIVVAASAWLSGVNERRVAKMCPGQATGPGLDRRSLAIPALVITCSLSILCLLGGAWQLFAPLWLLGIGTVLAHRGRASGAGAYVVAGGVLAAGGAVSASLVVGGAPGGAASYLATACLLGVAFPTALYVNRRYLWHRPEPSGRP